MSIIFSEGVRATSLAGIKTAALARIETQTDGRKTLNVESMVAWLNDQFAQMKVDNEATVETYMNGIDTRALAMTLANAIAPTTLSTRADWPSPATTTAPTAVAGALSTMFAELKTLSSAVGNVYADAKTDLAGLILDYIASAIAPSMPKPVQRMIEKRGYIYTWVTDRDEESAPSPASELIELDQNDTTAGSVPAAPIGRHITKARLYRSNLSTISAERAEWQLVKELDVATGSSTTWEDAVESAMLAEVCPTATWDEPPADLRYLVALPNGILAGIVGDTHTIAFSEPNVPYAWPADYQQTVEHQPVALGVFGQTLFVGTKGNPVYMSGSDSASMSAMKIPSNQILAAAESIARGEGGIVFASGDGLCVADQAGVRVITAGAYTREDWQALNPSSMRCAIHDGVVYVKHATGCLAISLVDGRIGTTDLTCSAMVHDVETDLLYLAQGLNVVPAFTGSGRRTALRKSKRFVLDRPASFGWLQCDSNYDYPVTIRVYGDGALVYEKVLTSREAVRFPAVRRLEWEVEVESQARVTAVTLAVTTVALQGAMPR